MAPAAQQNLLRRRRGVAVLIMGESMCDGGDTAVAGWGGSGLEGGIIVA